MRLENPAIGGPFKIETVIFSKNAHWLAGDTVLIAPVSASIPCKQGILQGKFAITDFDKPKFQVKRLRRRYFLNNRLRN